VPIKPTREAVHRHRRRNKTPNGIKEIKELKRKMAAKKSRIKS